MSAYLKNIKNEMDDRSGRYMKRRYQNKEGSHCFRCHENMQSIEDKTRMLPLLSQEQESRKEYK
ncbi:hypothetical protein HMPREF0661_05305 [Prevotella melaninogenica DNF00666]|uniref:Uncharacterized protein n=1 Tax=Prevotella melaninogenica DNF00666 TaxID=1401073 RepID=A0A096C4M9_9BACT|nr:hypothetical protein HMPREF0661_05305 [Prevotella melaninogenica DNF00666]